ncbi:MAG: isoprenylcysteine carboxylmethyltransferase family protein [Anaerolineae bacterium]|nr:isoprenylcysteine carboxylmethyltransferase family protein [Anaerolineae bacterium]
MQILIYLLSAALLLAAAYIVFHRVVAKDYLERGRLGGWASALQLLIFTAFFCFPYIYMPPEWSWDWLPNGTWNRMMALVLVVLGMVGAFGTMFWFGIRRAFGVQVKGIVRGGPYRYTRNPQMLGGWLMVLGVFVYLPSLYNLGWVLIWAMIGHWMVTNEETHLRRVFGEEYEQYCKKTRRYLF